MSKLKAAVLSAKFEPRKGWEDKAFKDPSSGKMKTHFGNKIWRYPKLELKDIPKPKAGPGELLVRVIACGICGSDVHFMETDADGYMVYPGFSSFPCVIGHEFAGVVEEVGPGAAGFEKGDLVCTEEMFWCGECIPCRMGLLNYCKNIEEIGFTVNGGMGEYAITRAKYCWKLNDLLNLYKSEERVCEAGSLVEPTGVAYNGIYVASGGFSPGGYAVVYGAGPIGLASIALLKAGGATKIIAFEPSAPRSELAKQVGAHWVLNPAKLSENETACHEKVMELTNGHGADIQVEAAGAFNQTWEEMECSFAIDGKMVILGRSPKLPTIDPEVYLKRRGKLYGGMGHSGHGTFMNVIRLMAGGMDMTKIITKRYPLDKVGDALEHAKKRIDGKITIKPFG